MNGNLLADDELRDIQGYQSIIIPNYVWWILGVLVFALIAYLLYKYVFSKKKEIILTVYEKTIIELDKLDTSIDSKAFYLEYSDIVRAYLLERVNLNLFDKTLNELRNLLDSVEIFDVQSKNQLLNIFAKADMAKFAKQGVSAEKRLEHIEKTKEILDKLELKLDQEAQKEKEKSLINLEDAELEPAKEEAK